MRFLLALTVSIIGSIAMAQMRSVPLCRGVFSGAYNRVHVQSEASQQAEQKRVAKLLAFNIFVTSRGLYEYSSEFSNSKNPENISFIEKMRNLSSEQRWLDSGAGRANAQLDLLKEFSNLNEAPELVALAYKRPFFVRLPKTEKMKYLSGRKLEEISDSELGKFDVITDFFGPASYGSDSIAVVNKYLRMTSLNSEIFLALPMMSVVYNSRLHKGVGLGDWLKQQLEDAGGFEVEMIHPHTLRIRRLNESSFQLPLLQQIRFGADAPPSRTYREVE